MTVQIKEKENDKKLWLERIFLALIILMLSGIGTLIMTQNNKLTLLQSSHIMLLEQIRDMDNSLKTIERKTIENTKDIEYLREYRNNSRNKKR